MSTRDDTSFGRMFRTFPIRTGLFTAGPVLVGLLLLLNATVNGGSLLYTGALFALTAAFSAMVTQYHLASFRLTRATSDLEEF